MSMRTQVEETIEVIRPALKADGGDIILRDVDDNQISLPFDTEGKGEPIAA